MTHAELIFLTVGATCGIFALLAVTSLGMKVNELERRMNKR